MLIDASFALVHLFGAASTFLASPCRIHRRAQKKKTREKMTHVQTFRENLKGLVIGLAVTRTWRAGRRHTGMPPVPAPGGFNLKWHGASAARPHTGSILDLLSKTRVDPTTQQSLCLNRARHGDRDLRLDDNWCWSMPSRPINLA